MWSLWDWVPKELLDWGKHFNLHWLRLVAYLIFGWLGENPMLLLFGMACKTSNDVLAWNGIMFGTLIEELQLCSSLYQTGNISKIFQRNFKTKSKRCKYERLFPGFLIEVYFYFSHKKIFKIFLFFNFWKMHCFKNLTYSH